MEGGEGTSLYLKSSGYSGTTPFSGKEPGSNGLTFDAQGRLVLCRHGDRQIGRLESNGSIASLADHYDGYKINSPNDLVFTSNGDLYFTDPPSDSLRHSTIRTRLPCKASIVSPKTAP